MQALVCLAPDHLRCSSTLCTMQWLISRKVFACRGHLCCSSSERLLCCVVLRGCGLQLEGVSRQEIVPAKISHSKPFHLAPLFPPSPDIGWHLCACLQWPCTHAGLCLCVCLGIHDVSQNYHDLLWFVARHNVRSQLVPEAKVQEVLCPCHEQMALSSEILQSKCMVRNNRWIPQTGTVAGGGTQYNTQIIKMND